MNLDTGLAVVILAILIFYLRLIILQRERVKRSAAQLAALRSAAGKTKGKAEKRPPVSQSQYSILSRKRRNWVIAGAGAAAILLGLLLNAGLAFPSMRSYWWIPLALGIVAFSWAFGLEDSDERA
jgi:sterol desaturase/sphingolipid hydroxylase (fatty acid hydroxylase superfamily)